MILYIVLHRHPDGHNVDVYHDAVVALRRAIELTNGGDLPDLDEAMDGLDMGVLVLRAIDGDFVEVHRIVK
jgi:hypothetical protein